MSSITDKPINHKQDDLLKVEKYSQALSNFITRSDTPITIGLQGEWGRGKNQLFYSRNPSRKTLGVNIYMIDNTGRVKKCLEELGLKYNLTSHSDLFYIIKDKSLVLESGLYEILGREKYRNLLTDIANEID